MPKRVTPSACAAVTIEWATSRSSRSAASAIPHTSSAAASVHTALEDRQPLEQLPLRLLEQLVGPIDRGLERVVAGGAAPP